MENPAFIGSIFDVYSWYHTGGFYRNFDKINQKHPTGVNLVKITKLGREIIEISIISTVQTHKLPYSARNKSKFRFIPSKVGIKASFYSNLGYHWRNFANIYQVYIFL